MRLPSARQGLLLAISAALLLGGAGVAYAVTPDQFKATAAAIPTQSEDGVCKLTADVTLYSVQPYNDDVVGVAKLTCNVPVKGAVIVGIKNQVGDLTELGDNYYTASDLLTCDSATTAAPCRQTTWLHNGNSYGHLCAVALGSYQKPGTTGSAGIVKFKKYACSGADNGDYARNVPPGGH